MISCTCIIITAHTNTRSTWLDPPGYHEEPVESFNRFLRDQLDCISLIIRVSILTQWRRGKLIIVSRVARSHLTAKRHGAHLLQHCNLKPSYAQSHTNLRVFLSGVISFGCDKTFQVGAALGLIEGVGLKHIWWEAWSTDRDRLNRAGVDEKDRMIDKWKCSYKVYMNVKKNDWFVGRLTKHESLRGRDQTFFDQTSNRSNIFRFGVFHIQMNGGKSSPLLFFVVGLFLYFYY